MTVTMMTTVMNTRSEKLEVRRKNPNAKAIHRAMKYIAYAVMRTKNIKKSSSQARSKKKGEQEVRRKKNSK